ncbi:MAG: universal stress protein [Cyanobacteria bacterium J06629_2]
MINKILVAIDCDPGDLLDFDSTLSLAQSTGASLMLLHVMSEQDQDYPVFPTYVYYQVLKNPDHPEYNAKWLEYEQQSLDYLRSLTKKAIAAGVAAEYTQLNGLPGQIICEIANHWSADLIVVGSRGLKGLNEIFLGSVSNYVTHHAPCSVLIMRSPRDSESDLALTPELNTQQRLTANQPEQIG